MTPINAIARLMAQRDLKPDWWNNLTAEERAAAAVPHKRRLMAILEDMNTLGLKVVPVEPTLDMQLAGTRAVVRQKPSADIAAAVWGATLGKAPCTT